MPTVTENYCLDDFTISVTASCDANITIPGSFPLWIEPGAAYFVGFTYITGDPAATGWQIAWTTVDDNGDTYPGESRPTVTITPSVPDSSGDLCAVKNGTIRGNVPSPSSNRQYNAILTILQA